MIVDHIITAIRFSCAVNTYNYKEKIKCEFHRIELGFITISVNYKLTSE